VDLRELPSLQSKAGASAKTLRTPPWRANGGGGSVLGAEPAM